MGKTARNDIEKYFEWWLDDAKVNGYIDQWDREGEEYQLFPPYKSYRMKYFKTKQPEKEIYNVIQKAVYTYDYRVVWNDKAKFLFFNPSDWTDRNDPPVLHYKDTFFDASPSLEFNGRYISLVDVKPPAKAAQYSGSLNSFATFPLVQKILLWNYGIYINKCVPIPMSGSGHSVSLFPNTFIPKRYFLTDGGGMTRKIKFKIQTLDQFVKRRKAFLEQINAMIRKIQDDNAKQSELFEG